MPGRIAYSQAIALTLMLLLFVNQAALAQRNPQSERAEAESRLKDLINNRRDEHWNFWETQLQLTPPPLSQPVQALPEWTPANYVLLTLDASDIWSFEINNYLGMESKGSEIISHDPKATSYVRSVVCATLRNTDKTEISKLKPGMVASVASFCKDVPKGESKGMVIANRESDSIAQLALTLMESLKDDKLLGILSQAHTFVKTVNAIAGYTHVLVVVSGGSNSEDSLYYLTKLMKGFPDAVNLLNSKSLQFVQIPIKTKWIRDYGPIFVRGADNQIICVDSRYETGRESIEAKQQAARMKELFKGTLNKKEASDQAADDSAEEDKKDKDNRLFDDISPSLLATRLRQKNGASTRPYPINVVRPPIELDGGNFFTDGTGVGFTSIETLQRNGGNVELLNLIFQQYFGQKEMVYLEPLPGSTIKHIDMFFKVINPDILLLGKFDTNGEGALITPLQTEAQRVLDYDLSVLKSFYESRGRKVHIVEQDTDAIQKGQLNIVRVPMPDLRRPIRAKLSKTNEDMAELVKVYEQHFKSSESAASLAEALKTALDTLKEDRDLFREAGQAIRLHRDLELVTPDLLEYVCGEIGAAVEYLNENHGMASALSTWQRNSRQIADLTQFAVDRETIAEADRAALLTLLGNALQSLESIIAQLQSDQTRLVDEIAQHNKELTHLREQWVDLQEQREQLQKKYPVGTDIYRTYLNSLQIRTDRANLLLLPSYQGLDEMEKRARDILRKVYSFAYGDVMIIPFDSDYFIGLSGSIHCLTQTIPAEIEVFSDEWNFRARVSEK